MAKPSIFSKDYEKRMKRRKRRTFFSIIVIIAIALVVIFTNNGIGQKIKNNLKQIKEETKAEEEQKNKQIVQNNKQKDIKKDVEKNRATVKKENNVSKDKNIEIQLENNIKIKLIYEDDKNKTIKSIDLNKNSLLYDINPSKNLIVVTNPKTQNIYLVNSNGNKEDITNKQYTSTSGTVFQKDTVLASTQDYLWGVSPKFIDNDNIAYISQLPWFNKTTKYIWIYNIKNKQHIYTENVSGEDVKIDKLTAKGLTINADGKTSFLKADGSIAQ